MPNTRSGWRLGPCSAGTAVIAAIVMAGCGGGKDPDVRHHEQGRIYLEKSRDYAKAAREFEQALSINPRRKDTVSLLARAYILWHHYEDALRTFKRFEDLGDTQDADLGRNETLLARAAWRLTGAGEFKAESNFTPAADDLAGADDYALKCIKHDSDDARGYLRRAHVAAERSRLHQAKSEFWRKKAKTARDLGDAAEEKDSNDKAKEEREASKAELREASDRYQKATEHDAKSISAYRQLIRIARMLTEMDRTDSPEVRDAGPSPLDAAETPARRLLDVQPDSEVALLALAGIAMERWRRHEEMRTFWKKKAHDARTLGRADDEQESEARAAQERTAARKSLKEVDQYALKILNRTPGHIQANLFMAQYAINRAQYERVSGNREQVEESLDLAIEHTQRVLARNRKHDDALRFQGLAYFQKEEYDMAVLAFERLMDRDRPWSRPKLQSETYLRMAVAYRKTANPQQALEALAQAIKFDHTNVNAINELGRAYIMEGRLARAQNLITRYATPASPALGQFLQALVYEKEAEELKKKGLTLAAREREHKRNECLAKAASQAPESWLGMLYPIAHLCSAARFEEAVQRADVVLATEAHHYEVRCWKARALIELGRLEEAIYTCRQNLELNPNHIDSHLAIMDTYHRYRRSDLAIRYAASVPREAGTHLVDRRLAVLFFRQSLEDGATENKDLLAALEAADRVLAKIPDDADMLLLAGEIHRRLGQLEDAERRYDDALARRPKSAKILHAAADAARASNNLPRAQDLFERALTEDPKQVASVYPLGMVLVAQGKAAEAADRFREATRSTDFRSRHYLGLLISLYAADRADEAAAIAARIPEILGPNQSLETIHAVILMGAGKFEEALAVLDAMEERHKARGAPISLRNIDHARALVRMMKDSPDRAKAVALQACLAEFYGLGGWSALAVGAAEKALASAPGSVNRMLALYFCLKGGGASMKVRALDVARRIAEADKDWAGAHALLAAQCEQSSRFDEAERALNQAIRLKPESVSLRYRLGALHERWAAAPGVERSVHLEKAIAAYRDASALPGLENDPLSAYRIYNNAAYLLAVHSANVPEALEMAGKAKTLAEKHPQLMRNPRLHGTVLDTIGWVEYLAGQHADAVKTLERANNLVPFNATLAYHLGMAHNAAGNKEAARRFLTVAIDVSPAEGFDNLEDARKALASLDAR